MDHRIQPSTAFDEHDVVRRLSEMASCTAEPESVVDLDIDFEQFGDLRLLKCEVESGTTRHWSLNAGKYAK